MEGAMGYEEYYYCSFKQSHQKIKAYQMFKTPISIARQYFKDKIARDQKANEFIYGQTDSLVTWLIGFSFTGMLLIISNLKSFNSDFNFPFRLLTIVLLAAIVFGLVFRFISFLVMTKEKELEEYYVMLFTEDISQPTEASFNVELAGVDVLVKALKEEFDLDYSYALYLDNSKLLVELPKIKKAYLDCCENSRKSLMEARSFIAKIEYDTHRIPLKVNETAFDVAFEKGEKVGYNSKTYSVIRVWCFGITLISFIAAVIIAGISVLLY